MHVLISIIHYIIFIPFILAKPVQVKIDGPYGRLMIPIYEYSHLMLVAGGVGKL